MSNTSWLQRGWYKGYKSKHGSREMAQWVRALLYKQEDLAEHHVQAWH